MTHVPERPTRSQVMLQIAMVVSERGTCDRKQVGAVIAREGRVISVGYNGAPPGLPHCDENQHGWERLAHEHFCAMRSLAPHSKREERDPWILEQIAENGCRNATHAEANALAFAAKYGVSTDKAQLFTTVAPCLNCARLLIAAGITSVEYIEDYRDQSGLDLLQAAGILPIQWKGDDEG